MTLETLERANELSKTIKGIEGILKDIKRMSRVALEGEYSSCSVDLFCHELVEFLEAQLARFKNELERM